MGTLLVAEPLDADTLQGCREDDVEAQRRVFDLFKDRVFSIAVDFLKGDEAAATDVSQEVFVKVFRGIRSFREDARFTTWLYRIVVNACKDELRRRRRFLLFANFPERLHPISDPPESEDVDSRIRAALGRLSPKLRMVVLLRYFEDLSYDEIASTVGVSAGTVASRLNRAHKFLGRELASLRRERFPHESSK